MSAVRWQFELTADQLPDLQRRLEWAMQRQNLRFVHRMPGQRMSVAKRAWFARVVSVLGLALIALLVVDDPAVVRDSPVFFVVMGSVFVPALVASFMMSRTRSADLRAAGKMLAREAEKVYAPVAAKVPYTVDYTLDGDRLEARVDRLGILRKTQLGRVKRALYAEHVVFLFRFGWSFQPFRFVYVPDAERTLVLAALERQGVQVECLDGALEGYEAPIAEARVR